MNQNNKHLFDLSVVSITNAVIISAAMIVSPSYAQTAPPPALGDETKGTPAIEEPATEPAATDEKSAASTGATSDENLDGEAQTTRVFGSSTVVESRRENGQLYSIELKHSNAPTQYIEETDSDGNIEYKSNDLEVTPNLPKWKIGSW